MSAAWHVMTRGAGVTGWLGVCALLCGFALLGGLAPHELLDWQPALAFGEPWRSVSAVAVHYSAAHLIANLAGAAGVAALGWAARIPGDMGFAWAAAWPLTQFGLLLDPELAHYGGLSGVLHAGVAVAAVHLMASVDSRQLRIGAAIGFGLVLKVGLEFPWTPAAFQSGLGISVAPLAHVSGSVAGLACAAVALWRRHHRAPQAHA